MNGFLEYNKSQAGNEPLDMLLLLGDNAYLEGTDEQWQGAFFDIYTEIIKGVATWPTIGNHEMGTGAPFDICVYRRIPACDSGPVLMNLGGISSSSDPDSYDSDGDGPDSIWITLLKHLHPASQRVKWAVFPAEPSSITRSTMGMCTWLVLIRN